MKRKMNDVEDKSDSQIQLDSFGVWYKSAQNALSQCNEKQSAFELHINLWSKLKVDGIKNNKTFLDIGIKIKEYKNISELIFLCPFKLDSDDIQDLSGKLQNKKNVDLIFNNNCGLWTSDRYWIISNDTSNNLKEDLLIFSFYQSVDDVIRIEEVVKGKSSKLVINFSLFKKYIESLSCNDENQCINRLKNVNDVYLRFRIASHQLNKSIFSNLEPMNKYFQSGFTSIQILDFKMNSKRNIDDRILAKAVGNDENFASFDKIHFLLMEPSNNNVIFMSENNTTCRNLEEGKWDNYLDCTGVGDTLVYHWKKSVVKNSSCQENNKPIQEFDLLVKINYSKTNRKIILRYIVYGFLVGIVGSYVTQWARKLIDYLLNLIFK